MEDNKLSFGYKLLFGFTIVCFVFGILKIFGIVPDSSKNLQNQVNTKEHIVCMQCGKDLSDTYQRIAPNGSGYYCMPCYNKIKGGSNYEPSSSSSSKTCGYCGNLFSGAGYNYGMGECHQGEGIYFNKCSQKCCYEAMRSDPNLR